MIAKQITANEKGSLTCGHWADENGSYLDDWTVHVFGFLFGIQIVHAVELEHVLVVLLLQQEDVLL